MIKNRQYHLLADHMAIYDFMCEIYDAKWANGVPAPFLEYALMSGWMDKTVTHRWRIWEEDGKIVGFVFSENPATDCFFSLRPRYGHIAQEMIAWADENMPGNAQTRQLILMNGQDALMQAAEKMGYKKTGEQTHLQYFYDTPLEYPLPEGFRFTQKGEVDPAKATKCCWKGFGHEEEEGPWDGDFEGGLHLASAPHATFDLAIAVENEAGEYVCYAGMWWTPQNKLAYMEPLCTIPQYRGKGLAAATLSELARRMKALGAAQMTGGANPFYEKIGFKPADVWTWWKK